MGSGVHFGVVRDVVVMSRLLGKFAQNCTTFLRPRLRRVKEREAKFRGSNRGGADPWPYIVRVLPNMLELVLLIGLLQASGKSTFAAVKSVFRCSIQGVRREKQPARRA